jgi:hypothetical protein
MKVGFADTMYVDNSTMYRVDKRNKRYALEKQWVKKGMSMRVLTGCVKNLSHPRTP